LDIPTVTNPPSVPSPSMDSTTILSWGKRLRVSSEIFQVWFLSF
jgi:hypothetical protein